MYHLSSSQHYLSRLITKSAMKGKPLVVNPEELRRYREEGLTWEKIAVTKLGTKVGPLRKWREINKFEVSATMDEKRSFFFLQKHLLCSLI